jgi:predicted RNase H-like nuclease (RuvC/YqgF family)
LRLIIDGKLTEQDREPQNVQVAVHEVSGVQVRLYLVDGTGVFHESEPLFRSQQAVPEQQKQFADLQEALADATRQNEALIGRLEEQQAELDGLQQALVQAQEEWALERQQAESRSSETTPTQEELVKLQEDLQAEKECTREIWRMNCQQLAEYD